MLWVLEALAKSCGSGQLAETSGREVRTCRQVDVSTALLLQVTRSTYSEAGVMLRRKQLIVFSVMISTLTTGHKQENFGTLLRALHASLINITHMCLVE